MNFSKKATLLVPALRSRDFRYFYMALVVAGLGAQVQSTANVWQVYELTGSPFHLGMTGLVRALPVLFLSLMGGVVADRVDRYRFIIVTQAVTGVLGLVLAGLTVTGQIQVWHIYAVTFISSSLSAIGAPARNAIIPNLVPQEHLLNAFALNSTVRKIAQILGPALAGVSIGLVGLAPTYLVNGVAHIVTVAALVAMHVSRVIMPPRKSTLNSLMEGLSFLRRQSIIPVLLGMDSAAVFFGSYRVLMPVFADKLNAGAAGLGLLLSSSGIGALLGVGMIMSLGDVRYKGRFVLGGILAYCCCLVLLALSPWFALALLTAALLGFCDSVQSIPRNAVIQSITPDPLRGRVSSFQSMLTSGVPALGQAQVGAVASLLGASLTLLVGAGLCAVTVVSVAFNRKDLLSPDLGSAPSPPLTPPVEKINSEP